MTTSSIDMISKTIRIILVEYKKYMKRMKCNDNFFVQKDVHLSVLNIFCSDCFDNPFFSTIKKITFYLKFQL